MEIGKRLLQIALGLLVTAEIAVADVPACYRDLELNFFRPNLVNETLSMHAISQSNWALINEELRRHTRRVPEMVRARAKQMNPNPLGSPFDSEIALQLLQQVLLEVFSETLSLFHITNQSKVEEMFQYIREQQIERLTSCK
jgi:hypothetical protein